MDESPAPRPARGPASPAGEDQALERYRYMLQTAPPETIEQAHAEAFSKLTPEQRRQVLSELAQASPAHERAAIAATPIEDSRALGRVATRAEIRQPGFMERTLGGSAVGGGALGGGGFGGGFLSSFAAGFVGSMVAQTFFSGLGGFGGHDGSADAATAGLDDAPADGDDGNFGDDLDTGGGDGFDGGDF